jgi:hypothetical protein
MNYFITRYEAFKAYPNSIYLRVTKWGACVTCTDHLRIDYNDISDNPRAYTAGKSCVHKRGFLVLHITSIECMAHQGHRARSAGY